MKIKLFFFLILCFATTQTSFGQGCATLTVSNDTAVCAGQQVRLNATVSNGTIVSQAWSPAWGLSSTAVLNPLTTVTVDTQYIFTTTATSTVNVITNGNFDSGNSGFSSAYTYVNNTTNPPPAGCTTWGMLSCESFYTVSTNPSFTHSNFSSFGDHTTGSGNMLVCNGSTNPNIASWCQTITVIPNTTYNFSAWVTNVDPFSSSTSLADLRFQVNSVQIGAQFSPVFTPGQWTQFNATWNSGANTSATICIMNQSTVSGGNDFAIDDIFFSPICTLRDTVRLTVKRSPIVTLPADTSVCPPANYTLSPTVSGSAPLTYLWQDGSSGTTFAATAAGNYWCRVTNQCGTATDSIRISLLTAPAISLGNDTTYCNTINRTIRPTVSGAAPVSLLWNDNSTADTLHTNTAGTYWATASNLCGTATDTIHLALNNSPTVSLPADTAFCDAVAYTLSPTVNGSAPLTYLWQDGSSGTTFAATAAGNYWCRVTNLCGTATDSIRISLLAAPAISLGNDTTYCNTINRTIRPTVSGAAPISLLWNDNSTADTLHTNTAGTYWATASNLCGTATDTIHLTLNNSPTVSLPADTAFCDAVAYTLLPAVSGTAPIIYLWSDNSSNNALAVNSAGSYWVRTTNSCGSATDTIRLLLLQSPAFSLGNDTVYCNTSNVTLQPTVSGSSPLIYTWQDNSSGSSFNATTSGNYHLRVSNSCNSAADTIALIFKHSPTIDLGNAQQLVCDQSSYTITPAIVSDTSYSVLWQNGAATSTFTATTDGVYSATVSNMCGTASDNIVLDFENTPTLSFSQDTFAVCETNVVLSPTVSNTANYTLQWNDSDTVAVKTASATGWYWAAATNSCGVATDSTFVHIISYPNPVYNKQTLQTCPNETITLNAQNSGATYLWNTGTASQSISVADTGMYYVAITYEALCSINDTVFIKNKNCTASTIFMPTAFTPNGDGTNETIFPFYSGDIRVVSFKIYNRWGEQVYNTVNPNGWDGTFKEAAQPIGVYVYYLEYLADGVSKHIKGTITLIR